MFRRSTMALCRTPRIQFRYGARPEGAAAAVEKSSTGKKSTPASSSEQTAVAAVLDSPWDLPPHLRPQLVEEVEIDCIRFGGAAPYPPEKKKK